MAIVQHRQSKPTADDGSTSQSVQSSSMSIESTGGARRSASSSRSSVDAHLPENTPLPESSRSTFIAGPRSARSSVGSIIEEDRVVDEDESVLHRRSGSEEDSSPEEHNSDFSTHNLLRTGSGSPRTHLRTASTVQEAQEEALAFSAFANRCRSESSGTVSSEESGQVDWDELERSEEQAPRDEGSDESTAFLLARLEQENDALATDPKAALARARSTRKNTKTRPPSIQHLKRLVNEPTKPSLRYSLVPYPPPMTELEFWAALVNDYPQTAQRLPTLTSNKIRGGVPPPLRGVVWMSIAGSRDRLLEDEYENLCGESSPYENLIGKDIGRSFPGVEMFRDPSGDGQQMLAKVLKCFSLYDDQIGYCQGLGFVVGPLLMHMCDKEAFGVLVRLMEHYDLRSCFLPDLSGLHLRIYQFQHLLTKFYPTLAAHLESIGVEPLYVSQWFLSFFAITCPLPMLLRIYDVILTEGASETLMRVALSLMRRNEERLLACAELEDAMSLLLGRALWDTYDFNADDLVNDFVGLTGLVSRESLESLEKAFKTNADNETSAPSKSVVNVQAAAARFLGRFWTGAPTTPAAASKALSPTSSLAVAAPSRPTSFLQRTPSKQSMTSTLNSVESSDSHITVSTEVTALSKNMSVLVEAKSNTTGISSQDRDLHTQIEDLLTALSNMQREHNALASELQREREDREEDRAAVHRYIQQTGRRSSLMAITEGETEDPSQAEAATDSREALTELSTRFNSGSPSKRSSLMQQTKHQMREETRLWKDQYEVETGRSTDLATQLLNKDIECGQLATQLQAAQSLIQEAEDDKQRLEKVIAELKIRRYSTESDFESMPPTPIDTPPMSGGLRELKLVRSASIRGNKPAITVATATDNSSSPKATPAPATFAKRTSSLGMSKVLATTDHKPPSEEALLVELVNAKTSEAVAREELEEVRGKLDALRKLLGTDPSDLSHARRPSAVLSTQADSNPPKLTPPSTAGVGGFFSGWGKRAASNPPVTISVTAES